MLLICLKKDGSPKFYGLWPFGWEMLIDETELFLSPLLSLSFFFSPSKKKIHRIKREKAAMATKCTEFCFIITIKCKETHYFKVL